MTALAHRPRVWMSLAVATCAGAALAAIIGWRLHLATIEYRIVERRAALKKLALSGGIPPSQDVMDYLTIRQAAVEERYRGWLDRVTVPPLAGAAATDPQVYFQERVHEVQRTIARLATARKLAVPEQLGLPKELPPSDTVPRLLVQLELIEEMATLVFERGAIALSSFKIEDPQTVTESEGGAPFLLRLPVRVTLTASLAQLMNVLGAVDRVQPLIDMRSLRIVNSPEGEGLTMELGVARYLMLPSQESLAPPATEPVEAQGKSRAGVAGQRRGGDRGVVDRARAPRQ